MFHDNLHLFSFLVFILLNCHWSGQQTDDLIKSETDKLAWRIETTTEVTQKHEKCEPISIPFCKGLDYNQTSFPNFLLQTHMEASLTIQQFSYFVMTKCHPHVRMFLCSLFFPACTETNNQIPPCKSLCLDVKRTCAVLLNKFFFEWPEKFNCNRFPDERETPFCIHPNTTSTSQVQQYESTVVVTEKHEKCEPISTPLCKGLDYNQTSFPNFLHYKTQRDASRAILQFSPLLITKCSPYIKFFLCSLYFPVCTEANNKIPPCKSLCLSVERSCEVQLNAFSFKWPEKLNCNRFPDVREMPLCIHLNTTSTTEFTETGLS